MNYFLHFAKHAQATPSQDALLLTDKHAEVRQRVSYQALHELTKRYANGLRSHGVEAGDVVLVLLKPGLEFTACSYALFYLGATPLFLDPGMGLPRLLKCIAQAKPQVLIGLPIVQLLSWLFRPSFRSITKRFVSGAIPLPGCTTLATLQQYPVIASPAKSVTDDTLLAIAYTSGSTGVPKGVEWQHGQMSAQIHALQQLIPLQPGSLDMTTFPLFLFISTASGHSCLLPDANLSKPGHIDPALLFKLLNKHRVNYSFGSPALWQNLVNYGEQNRQQLSYLSAAVVGGAPVPVKLAQRLQRLAPQAEVNVVYGATEALPMTASALRGRQEDPDAPALPGLLVGKPVPGIALCILPIDDESAATTLTEPVGHGEIGEIYVTGPMVTERYFQAEALTKAAKWRHPETGTLWHKTGDAGYLDRHGQLWYCGRVKHRIRQGLRCLYTVNVEQGFNQQPEIERCAILAHPHEPQSLALVVEVAKNWQYAIKHNNAAYQQKWLGIAQRYALVPIEFFIHPKLPVDARHNAKINYEALADWLQRQPRSNENLTG